jgi:hypothetical protein
MNLQNKITIGDHRDNYAEITDCGFSIWKTFTGFRFSFNFTVKPFSTNTENSIVLDSLHIDLSFRAVDSSILLGRMIGDLSECSRELKGYEFSITKLFDIQMEDFIRLVDVSHRGDMQFEFNTKPIFFDKMRQGKFETAYLKIPHSEWLNYINNAELDRFELISIRIPVSSSHLHSPFVEAVKKIREAEQQYIRGDWNGAASSCRSAWRTVLSSAPPNAKPIEHLLSSVTGDPRRKNFAEALLKGLLDIQNKAVHLEGDIKTGTPPADVSPEDALLCIHWYSTVIGYLSSLK